MSISGSQSKDSGKINNQIIEHLKTHGEVLTEHFANPNYKIVGESDITDKQIHDRDMNWLLTADFIVAEVSNASLGVGYEIGRAIENKKKILCLGKKSKRRLSAMIKGSDSLTFKEYKSINDAKNYINEFIKNFLTEPQYYF
jgi:nucleoside 2-deoxyribosyltransferase